jgi:hypothetical protein
MFRLKKLHPPLGTKEAPVIEASYAEGTVEVVDGQCTVKLPETRDRLLKTGYVELAPDEPAQPSGKGKKRR